MKTITEGFHKFEVNCVNNDKVSQCLCLHETESKSILRLLQINKIMTKIDSIHKSNMSDNLFTKTYMHLYCKFYENHNIIDIE